MNKFSIFVLIKLGVGKTNLINSILSQNQHGTTIGLPIEIKKSQIRHTNP